MTPQLQEHNIHRPLKGEYGDCPRAAIASILDISIADVPHFSEGIRRWNRNGHNEVAQRMREWLAPERTLWWFFVREDTLEKTLHVVGAQNLGMRYMVSGGTKHRGINHMICCRGVELEWNPSLTAEIISPMWPDRVCFAAGIIGENL